jgi:hypothetical protein
MKFKIFGITISNEDDNMKLSSTGASANIDKSKQKISQALQEIENKQLKFSEYRLQKISGVSLNTIKKYREFIAEERERLNNRLI